MLSRIRDDMGLYWTVHSLAGLGELFLDAFPVSIHDCTTEDPKSECLLKGRDREKKVPEVSEEDRSFSLLGKASFSVTVKSSQLIF